MGYFWYLFVLNKFLYLVHIVDTKFFVVMCSWTIAALTADDIIWNCWSMVLNVSPLLLIFGISAIQQETDDLDI